MVYTVGDPIPTDIPDGSGVTPLQRRANQRIVYVDRKTKQLISQGFTFDGRQFSLSLPAQKNWLGLKTLEDILQWPVKITTIDDLEYSLAQSDLNAFLLKGEQTLQTHLDNGRSIKNAMKTAATLQDLALIKDNR